MNVYYDTVASTATVVGTLYLREIHVCFYLVIGHWLIRQVGFSKGLRFGLLLLESSISRLFMYVDVLFISIYSISLDSSDYKVVSTLLMFTNSYMWCIFALIHDFCTRNVTAITSEPFSWLENGWRRSSGLLSPMIPRSDIFSLQSRSLIVFLTPLMTPCAERQLEYWVTRAAHGQCTWFGLADSSMNRMSPEHIREKVGSIPGPYGAATPLDSNLPPFITW